MRKRQGEKLKGRGAISRRAVVAGAAVTAFGAPIPMLGRYAASLAPAARAEEVALQAVGKTGLTLLSDRPLNLETPPHLLDDRVTPAGRLFVRNNGLPPEAARLDPATWRLDIDGEVDTPLSLTIPELQDRFETVDLQLPLECAGNGRKFFEPSASGNQWTFGGIGCPRWTGVRLRDVLEAARPKKTCVYTGHYGADMHLSGNPDKAPISRGVPIAKAMEPHTLIAFAMNGEPMPLLNGHPLRLIVPGWPGSCSQKWLTRITLRDRMHDGPKMMGKAYRMPKRPALPGGAIGDEEMEVISTLPLKSLVTFPETGAAVAAGAAFEVRGHAWAGEDNVAGVDISTDFGATWRAAELAPQANPFAWRHWRAEVEAPTPGYYEVWARARDTDGGAQPPVPPGWNPKGYLNNMQHRIAVMAS
ncbi:MAG: sulfite oxidase [Pseudomonadota bacterium]